MVHVLDDRPAEANMHPDALADDAIFMLARARAIGAKRTHRNLMPLRLTEREYAVLALATEGSRPTQKQLADRLLLNPSQIVTIIDELQRRGLVTRESDPTDRRSKSVAVTDIGQELFMLARRAVKRAEDEALRGFTQDERTQLLHLLNRIGG